MIQVACGYSYTAFVTKYGDIYTFGSTLYGKLGLGTVTNCRLPTKIQEFDNIIQVSCGVSHTAFITKQGKIYTFGTNKHGQLGLSTSNNMETKPQRIEGFNDIIQVACGREHTAFITKEGNIYTCGSNENGQLDLGLQIHSSNKPLQIRGFNKVKQVACGMFHTAFITESGEVYTFGSNSDGELGLNNVTDKYIPTLIPSFNKIMAVSCGYKYTAFIKE